jgi:hypothetical protein
MTVLQGCFIEHRIGQKLLQLAVLALEPSQALGLRDFEPAVLGFPVVQARLADPVLPAKSAIR